MQGYNLELDMIAFGRWYQFHDEEVFELYGLAKDGFCDMEIES